MRVGLATLVLAALAGEVGLATALALPGDLDPTFGNGGLVIHDLGANDNAFGALVQPDGKVLAVGSSSGTVALARYAGSGALDASFGGDGTVTTPLDGPPFPGSAFAFDAALQADGKIVIVGTSGGFNELLLARYHPDGSLDAGFDGDGVLRLFLGSPTSGSAVVVQPDGKIVAVGRLDSPFDPWFSSFATFRFNSDGSPDATFDGDGRVMTRVGPLGAATDVALTPDGRIAVAGAAGLGPDRLFVVAMYAADGQLAAGFGTGGLASVDFGGFDEAAAIALQEDGKAVVVGRSTNSFAVARLTANGNLDASFDGDGKLIVQFDAGPFAVGADVIVQRNEKLVVAGTSLGPGVSDFAVARLTTSGALDGSFGGDGRITTTFGPGRFAMLSSVALAPNGQIVATGFASGTCEPSGFCPSNFALARYEGDPTVREVAVDIRPGSDENPVNVGASVVPVAILTTSAFDATTVDAPSVCFGDAEAAAQRDCTEAHGRGHVEDANADGRPDLVLHFETAETGVDPGDTTACLTGRTSAGIAIRGCDMIRTS